MNTVLRSISGVSNGRRKKKKGKELDLCKVDQNDIPGVGGIEVLDDHLEAFPILPPYVALFEPTDAEIWAGPKQRLIFLNQPLQPWEQAEMERFRPLLLEALGLLPTDDLPRWILPHMTRLLQQTKYKSESAAKLGEIILVERVKKLPISFQDVRKELEMGFLYWHGRDAQCRPLMVLRVGRAAQVMGDKEAVQRAFLFNMEYAVRYLLVPGRVENWAVLIDCAGIEQLPGVFKCKDFGQTIATTMGKVYSGRMVWLKLFNFPKGFTYRALKMFIEGIVNALGKSDKVAFVTDAAKELQGKVELGQLERWAGGTAPDLPPANVYPYRMFADPKGYREADSGVKPVSLHNHTDVEFHEGFIWADCLDKQTGWREKAAKLPLPPCAAPTAGIAAVNDIDLWHMRMRTQSQSFSTAGGSPVATAGLESNACRLFPLEEAISPQERMPAPVNEEVVSLVERTTASPQARDVVDKDMAGTLETEAVASTAAGEATTTSSAVPMQEALTGAGSIFDSGRSDSMGNSPPSKPPRLEGAEDANGGFQQGRWCTPCSSRWCVKL